nr:hypothetical protein [Allomuricauda sp.]
MKDKRKINPEYEYDALRQEILKRIGIHFMIRNINLTVSGVLLGLAVSENSLIALVLPPLALFLAVTMKNNTLSYMKIGNYLRNNYTLKNNSMNWQKFNHKLESSKSMKVKRSLFGIGSFGVFSTAPLIAIAIGLIEYQGKIIEKFLIGVDILSIIGIILIFIMFSTRRIDRIIKMEVKKAFNE